MQDLHLLVVVDVNRLRQKPADGGADSLIATIRGVGHSIHGAAHGGAD